MADKMIGKLTIDISDIEKKLDQVNKALAKVGAGVKVDLSKDIGKEVKAQLDGVLKEIQGYEAKMNAAVDKAINNATERTTQRANTKDLTDAIRLWREYYNVMAQAETALRGNNRGRFDELRQEAEAIRQRAAELRAEKDVWEQTAAARRRYETAYSNTVNKERQRNEIESAKAVAYEVNETAKAKAAEEKQTEAVARATQKEIVERQKLVEMYRQMFDEIDRKNAVEMDKKNAEAYKQEQEAIKKLITLYDEYFKYQEKSAKANNADNQSMYNNLASGKYKEIQELLRQYPALSASIQQAAKSSEQFNAAQTRLNDTLNNERYKQAKDDTEKYSQALVNLYNEQTKLNNSIASGRIVEGSEEYEKATERINHLRDVAETAGDKLSEAGRKSAEGTSQVVAAMDSLAQSEARIHDADMSSVTTEIEKATQAFVKLLEAQANLDKTAMTKGKSSKEYAEAAYAVDKASEAFLKYSDDAQKAAIASEDAKRAVVGLDNVLSQTSGQQYQTNLLKQAEDAYKKLTQAISDYQKASRAKDQDGMRTSQDQINSQMQMLNALEQEIQKLSQDSEIRRAIADLISRARIEQNAFNNGVGIGTTQTNDLQSAVNGLVTRYLSLLAVIRMIKNVMGEMIEYVSEYSDKMNEIRIITGKTEEEAERLGETYRDLAESMSVSSLDMADAAIYFTRQGLGATEIEQRLKSTTRYAKTANIEFERAAELITAVVNSMGLVEQEAEDGRKAADRVADVFLKVGDNAATSGEEIGEAMQKAAASAGTFGVSFEWLAAYIATVSETTRQEARTIGTAFNTIIARLHQIKQTGYNSEDETKINDIAKALANVDIALMDQSGEWRDMTDIFEDVASKWDELDDKTRSYIATTMAGVKQQNVFLALMNDMAKGTEEGSRAYELYGLAINSAGTAEEKYATYTESVTAAQERLTVAQEKFYALLKSDTLKWFYDMMTNIVNVLTKATEKFKGINIVLPVMIGLVVTLGVAFGSAAMKAGGLGAALGTFTASHPVVLGILAMVAAFTALSGIAAASASNSEIASRRYAEMVQQFEKAKAILSQDISTQKQFNDMMEEFDSKGALTNDELQKYNGLLDELSKMSPNARQAVEELRQGVIDQADAFKILNDEIEKNVDYSRKDAARKLGQTLSGWTPNAVDENSNTPKNLPYFSRIAEHSEWFVGNDANEQFVNAMRNAYNAAADEIRENVSGAEEFWEDIQAGTNMAAQFFGLTKQSYHEDNYSHRQNWLPEELFDAMSPAMSDEEILRLGRAYFGDINMGDSGIDQLRDELEKQANQIVNDLFSDMSLLDQNYIHDYILRSVMGEDMEITQDEYNEMGKVLSNFIYDLIDNGFDIMKLDPNFAIHRIGNDLFASMFDMYFDESEINSYRSPEMVRKIADVYQQLLSAGFSQVDLAFVYQSLNIDQWGEAADIMKQQMIDSLRNAFTSKFGTETEIDVDDPENEYFRDWLSELDMESIKVMYDLQQMGVTQEEMDRIWAESGQNVSVFIQSLRAYREELGGSDEDNEKFVEKIKKITAEMDKLEKMVKTLRDGETIDFEDLLNLADAHPELMTAVNDTDTLIQKLQELKSMDTEKAISTMRNKLMNDAGFAESSGLAGIEKGQTLQQVKDNYTNNNWDTSWIDSYVDSVIISFLGQTDRLGSVGKDMIAEWTKSMFSDSNVDLLNRQAIQVGEDTATVLTETMTASLDGEHGLQWNGNIVMNLTPITPDGTLLDDDTFYQYVEDLLSRSGDINALFENDKIENGGKGLLISVDEVIGNNTKGWEEATAKGEQLAFMLHLLQEAYYGVADANKTWLELQVEQQEIDERNEWAKSNNFVEQIGGLSRALERGGIEEAYTQWNQFDDAMKKSVSDTYPELARAMLEVERAINDNEDGARDLDKAYDHLDSTLKKSMKLATAKNFTGTYQAIQKLEKGTISATDAYDTFNKELDTVVKAGEDVTDVEDKIAHKTEVTASDVSNLSKLLGVSAEEILQDWPAAVAAFDEMTGAAGELKDVFDMLNQAAFIRITGVSEADFSNIENGLLAVGDMAQETIDLLAATGQWEVQEIPLNGFMSVFRNGKIVREQLNGMQKVLKATGKNPYAGRGTGVNKDTSSGRGGGGGGGDKNSKDSGMTEVERMLDRMSQANAIQEYQQSYYQAQKNYYDQTGRLQGVIGYSQREIDLLKEQSNILENNISTINQYIEKKKAELATLSNTDESYEEVADDLDKLQKAHQEYTNQLIENRTAIEELTESIDEQHKKIREMEISLRQTILKAIEDREKRTEDMLNAEIEMENTIIDLITKRYEKERDQIIETTNMKIDALQQERDLLDEQLQIRKEQQEAEDKQLKLRELEAKYQRIIADPTRMKEAKSIKSEIDDLRKEMAWDLAENEVKAQQDSIDQQIESLEDYVEYVQNYYEDLFEHPQKLIAEMKDIMMMTDAEIIDWLKTNDEEYARSTENTQATMVTSWQDTLDTMHDVIKTYWDEVEFIISQGEDYIINFLMENSEDYRNAGKLQAEAYVDEWKEQLDDLRKAHEAVATQIAASYSVIEKADSSSSSSKSGGGGGSGGKGNGDNNNDQKVMGSSTPHGYSVWINGKKYKNQGYASEDAAANAAQTLIDSYFSGARITSSEINYLKKEAARTLTTYQTGGLATSTGPAWLDGTASNPERVLSPYQTKLFEVMVNALENINRLSIPTMSNMSGIQTSGGNPVSVGDIIVNVDNLDTDDDYEELADKVGTVIMERLGRTAAIGGLRIRSI